MRLKLVDAVTWSPNSSPSCYTSKYAQIILDQSAGSGTRRFARRIRCEHRTGEADFCKRRRADSL